MLFSSMLLYFVLAASVAVAQLRDTSQLPPSLQGSRKRPPLPLTLQKPRKKPRKKLPKKSVPESPAVAAAPLPGQVLPGLSSEESWTPLAQAKYLLGDWMRGSVPDELKDSREPKGDDVVHKDDHLCFHYQKDVLYLKLQRANGTHIIPDAGWTEKVSDLDAKKHPLVPGIWLEMTVDAAQQHPLHPAAQHPVAKHDAIWMKIGLDKKNENKFVARKLKKGKEIAAAAQALAAFYKIDISARPGS